MGIAFFGSNSPRVKGDPLSQNWCRGIKLLEHGFILYDKILDEWLSKVVNIDKKKYRFMWGKETTDVVFVLRRFATSFRSRNKKLSFVFIDLEKAFNWVPKKVICFALRWNDALNIW